MLTTLCISKMAKSPSNSRDVSKSEDISGEQDSITTDQIDKKEKEELVPKTYIRRWFMLAIFCFVSLSNAFQWIQYASIANVVRDYYEVSQLAVDWLSMIFMLLYIPLIFPVTWTLDKHGLKVIGVFGSSLNCLGAWLKYAGAAPHLFALAFVGQSICSVGQVFILGIPARLAAVWFGPRERSTACAIGVFGNTAGVALGFALPPLIVPNDEHVEQNMKYIMLGTSIITSVLFLLLLVAYKGRPPIPPSQAQLDIHLSPTKVSYLQSVINLLKNRSFLFLFIAYGVNVGAFYAVSTLLNQIVLSEYPGEEAKVGTIGFTIVLTGLLGSLVIGIWLDRTRTFKQTTVVTYIFSFICMVLFAFTLTTELWVVNTVAAFLGFFMTGYLPLGFEFAAEITYPEPEGTSSGLLNASAQTLGIIFILIMGKILDASVIGANLFLSGALLIGTIITVFIRSDLRRQKAEVKENSNNTHEKTQNEDPEEEVESIQEKSSEDTSSIQEVNINLTAKI